MKKSIFLIFALIFISISLLTSTDILTLFGGSHSIVGITSEQNDITCVDCHQQIQNELDNSAIHSDLSCESCHRFNGTGIVFAVHNTTGIYKGKQAHASYTPACLDCHGSGGVYITNKTGSSVYAPPAPEFNESYGSDNSTHKAYVEASISHGLSVGENEACIACHTNYSMKFKFKRPEYIQYDIVDTHPAWAGAPTGRIKWEIQNFVRASDNTTTISVSRTGSKHQWISSSIECFDCHSDVASAVEKGGHIPSSLKSSINNAQDRGHTHRRHNFSRSDADISVCESCHLTNYSKFGKMPSTPNDVWFNHSGHAKLDYHAATTEHCKTCHRYGAEKAIDQGFCLCNCHSILASNGNSACYGNWAPFDHKNLTGNMESLSYWSDSLSDKVCVACHLPGGYEPPFLIPFPNENSRWRFRVYTEPYPYVESPKIKDNLEGSYVGTWPLSTAVGGYFGSNYQYHEAGDGSNTFTWRFAINLTEEYEVWARWTQEPNRATNAPYTIYYSGGSETVRVNQELNGGKWYKLGTYNFTPGEYSVVLSDDANEYVIADAVVLVMSSS